MIPSHGRASTPPIFGIQWWHSPNIVLPVPLRLPWFQLQHARCWSYWHHWLHPRFLRLCICSFSLATPCPASAWVSLDNISQICTSSPTAIVCFLMLPLVNLSQLPPDSSPFLQDIAYDQRVLHRWSTSIWWLPCPTISTHKIFLYWWLSLFCRPSTSIPSPLLPLISLLSISHCLGVDLLLLLLQLVRITSKLSITIILYHLLSLSSPSMLDASIGISFAIMSALNYHLITYLLL